VNKGENMKALGECVLTRAAGVGPITP